MKGNLPVDKKFTIWFDEDGDYIIQSADEPGLGIHGATPDETVQRMIDLIPEWDNFPDKE